MKTNLTFILRQPLIFNNVIHKQSVIQKTISSRALNTSTVLSSEKLCFVEKLGGEEKGIVISFSPKIIKKPSPLIEFLWQLGISIININNPTTKNAISRNLLREFRDTVNNLRFEK